MILAQVNTPIMHIKLIWLSCSSHLFICDNINHDIILGYLLLPLTAPIITHQPAGCGTSLPCCPHAREHCRLHHHAYISVVIHWSTNMKVIFHFIYIHVLPLQVYYFNTVNTYKTSTNNVYLS